MNSALSSRLAVTYFPEFNLKFMYVLTVHPIAVSTIDVVAPVDAASAADARLAAKHARINHRSRPAVQQMTSLIKSGGWSV